MERHNKDWSREEHILAFNLYCKIPFGSILTVQPLLTASHIIPWSEDEKNRLNPKNGLCLNALHDRAFDRHLMWVENDFVVRFSPKLHESNNASKGTIDWLTQFEGSKLLLPKKFSPDSEFLNIHADKCKSKL